MPDIVGLSLKWPKNFSGTGQKESASLAGNGVTSAVSWLAGRTLHFGVSDRRKSWFNKVRSGLMHEVPDVLFSPVIAKKREFPPWTEIPPRLERQAMPQKNGAEPLTLLGQFSEMPTNRA